tara:strand:- start:657 stop:959 length:303 start_codon:yes stop_codon:yes gene_type:complete
MKLDIKSFLIGILTTVNLFLLYGFTTADENDKEVGRYQIVRTDIMGGGYMWVDTSNGEVVASVSPSVLRPLYKEKLVKLEDLEPTLSLHEKEMYWLYDAK